MPSRDAKVHREPVHREANTASIMHHVLAKTGGINSKFKVGRESRPRCSRVVLSKPTVVAVLPGADVHARTSKSNDRKTAYVKVTRFVQWYDPSNRPKHAMSLREGVKGITGKLEYQGVDERGMPIWA